jgi:hypothetical protein
MDLGFRGEVADFYHKYRRGYPPTVIAAMADAFKLTGDDVVVGLGCGRGQLTLPIARQIRRGAAAVRANDRACPWPCCSAVSAQSINHPTRARSTPMRVPQDAVRGNGRDFAVGWNGRSGFFVLGLRTGRRPG